MIVAMVVVPTLLGLLLAAVLFDYLGKRFDGRGRPARCGPTYYLPQILPVAVAGIALGLDPQPADRRAERSCCARSGSESLARNWLATRRPPCQR